MSVQLSENWNDPSVKIIPVPPIPTADQFAEKFGLEPIKLSEAGYLFTGENPFLTKHMGEVFGLRADCSAKDMSNRIDYSPQECAALYEGHTIVGTSTDKPDPVSPSPVADPPIEDIALILGLEKTNSDNLDAVDAEEDWFYSEINPFTGQNCLVFRLYQNGNAVQIRADGSGLEFQYARPQVLALYLEKLAELETKVADVLAPAPLVEDVGRAFAMTAPVGLKAWWASAVNPFTGNGAAEGFYLRPDLTAFEKGAGRFSVADYSREEVIALYREKQTGYESFFDVALIESCASPDADGEQSELVAFDEVLPRVIRALYDRFGGEISFTSSALWHNVLDTLGKKDFPGVSKVSGRPTTVQRFCTILLRELPRIEREVGITLLGRQETSGQKYVLHAIAASTPAASSGIMEYDPQIDDFRVRGASSPFLLHLPRALRLLADRGPYSVVYTPSALAQAVHALMASDDFSWVNAGSFTFPKTDEEFLSALHLVVDQLEPAGVWLTMQNGNFVLTGITARDNSIRRNWWNDPEMCNDLEAAEKAAPLMNTSERVDRFGTERCKVSYNYYVSTPELGEDDWRDKFEAGFSFNVPRKLDSRLTVFSNAVQAVSDMTEWKVGTIIVPEGQHNVTRIMPGGIKEIEDRAVELERARWVEMLKSYTEFAPSNQDITACAVDGGDPIELFGESLYDFFQNLQVERQKANDLANSYLRIMVDTLACLDAFPPDQIAPDLDPRRIAALIRLRIEDRAKVLLSTAIEKGRPNLTISRSGLSFHTGNVVPIDTRVEFSGSCGSPVTRQVLITYLLSGMASAFAWSDF